MYVQCGALNPLEWTWNRNYPEIHNHVCPMAIHPSIHSALLICHPTLPVTVTESR